MGTELAELEARFDDAMMNIYKRALDECRYNATRFLQMVCEHRGVKTARIFLNTFRRLRRLRCAVGAETP